ncbi:beta-N-acetylhexosaminidase [Mycoavidus sp. HKI]|uniref:beta-N-acetylhexosaminidase n=1 Tax=Mycoavidus sp. HKI TaxID=2840467 RepID=UPI001CBC9F23|nr:beta-N-acetylhexosaminidase [Mycoavidus sp. HKI]UAW63776.1 beta-N-acetylhexosaminidase [Mycoavidus sp. HKI]
MPNLSANTLGPVMLDVAGTELTEEEIRRLVHPLTGGIILFARNFQSRAQLLALTEQIREVRNDLLITVDHEGGRVQRFKTDGFTHLPAMRGLGQLWEQDVLLATRAATAVGYILALELRASHIDFSFTPILDLDYGQSKVIGNRAFHHDPRVITLLAKSLSHGLALAGLANCGKHFPGHGFVEADSHYAMAVDTRTLDVLLQDAQPYRWLDVSLAAVMPAHIVYPAVDARPAGFSKIWLQNILREQLGFTGAILSDDLSMEGARTIGNFVESAQVALDAGCDMVLVCNLPQEAERVLAELRYTPSATSASRIKRLAARGEPIPWHELEQHPQYLAAKALLVELAL